MPPHSKLDYILEKFQISVDPSQHATLLCFPQSKQILLTSFYIKVNLWGNQKGWNWYWHYNLFSNEVSHWQRQLCGLIIHWHAVEVKRLAEVLWQSDETSPLRFLVVHVSKILAGCIYPFPWAFFNVCFHLSLTLGIVAICFQSELAIPGWLWVATVWSCAQALWQQ